LKFGEDCIKEELRNLYASHLLFGRSNQGEWDLQGI